MKQTVASLVAAAALVGAAVAFGGGSAAPSNPNSGALAAAGGNVSVVDGTQIIEITAKGGYAPEKTVAKAGLPTVLRFETNGTFDCSSSVRIPSLGVGRRLPQSGATDIDVGTPAVGQLAGTCSMGMYSFAVDFAA